MKLSIVLEGASSAQFKASSYGTSYGGWPPMAAINRDTTCLPQSDTASMEMRVDSCEEAAKHAEMFLENQLGLSDKTRHARDLHDRLVKSVQEQSDTIKRHAARADRLEEQLRATRYAIRNRKVVLTAVARKKLERLLA